MKAIWISILWIVAGLALFYAGFCVYAFLNLFSWGPSLDWEVVCSVVATLGIEVFIVWLAKHTKGIVAGTVSLLVSIALVYVATEWFFDFQSECIAGGCSEGSGRLRFPFFLNRRALSPVWFRISFLSVFMVPIILWFCFPLRQVQKKYQKKSG